MTPEQATSPEETKRAEGLLCLIDRIARDYDHHEYGLPWHGEPAERIAELVVAAFRTAVLDEREACAKVVDDKTESNDLLAWWRRETAAAIRERGVQ